ncbi:hypothetical protein P1X15_29795 [Runella sp. MFBS21]|uniref:hypothetical protein n=1 Tax=Runella sp. MFBS21 TaxID=3034018 RepID=UPI0023F9BBA5|nr:hypothetical protein [Runella sp. MFBS21]MDF7821846.1 hypothetical protein [Runella sp. MFBS21]
MYNQKIHEFAKKYDIPESAFDESIIPLLVAMDKVIDSTNGLTEKVKGSIHNHQHFYDKGKPLDIFFARWGWGVWVFIGMLIIAFLLMYFSENRRKLEKLESVMQYNDSTRTYFIDSKFYKVVNRNNKKGVLINP